MSQAGAYPYPGIRPFREDEEYLFFGREAQVDALVDTLSKHRFLAIIGSSGCGKSSLVNCGLRPALHRGLLGSAGSRWRMATCRPGADPLRALAQALARPGALHQSMPTGFFSQEELIESTLAMGRTGLVEAFKQANLPAGTNLLLVIDQFEELFRYQSLHASNQAEGDPGVAFVNLLLEARRQDVPIYIVLTMRSDFLGDCARFSGLPEAINQGQYLVPRMSRDERRAAIHGPARVFASELAPTLLTRLVNDVGDDPDQLSLLQHALARTWEHWQESGDAAPISPAHYEAVGTLSGALNQHAEELYAGLSPAAQAGCATVFRTLTDKSTDSRGIRRPTRFGDLVAISGLDPSMVWSILAPFRAPNASFLMPPAGEELQPDTVIDLAHESLMRIWRRLKEWGDIEAEAARMLHRLCDAAELHAAGQASLWRDPELQFALDWQQTQQPTLAWARQYGRDLSSALHFLEASHRARDEEAATEMARTRAEQQARETQARQRRVLRLTIGAICASTVVAGALAFLWQRAEFASEQALSRQLAAQSTTELLNGHTSQSLQLAADAWASSPTLEAEDSLLVSLNHAPEDWFLAGQDGVIALATSPDGRMIASAGANGSIRLWRAGDSEPLATLEASQPVQALAFSPDGKTLASGSSEGQLILWDTETHKPRGPALEEHQGAIQSLTWSPANRLASAGADQMIMLRNGSTGEVESIPLRGHQDVITRLRFSPDGQLLASVGYDGVINLWDFSVEGPRLQSSHHSILHDVVFSPDSRKIAIATADRQILLFDTSDLSRIGQPLTSHEGAVRALLFTNNGRNLLSGGDDRQLLNWDLTRPDSLPDIIAGHGGTITALTEGNNANHIVSAGADDLISWHMQPHQAPEMLQLPPEEEAAWALAWSSKGNILAASDSHGRILLMNTHSASELQKPLEGHTDLVTRLAWADHDRILLSAGQDGLLQLWRPDSSREPQTLYQGSALLAMAVRPAGDEVAVVDQQGQLLRWKLPAGTALPALKLDGPLVDVAWSSDSKLLAAITRDGRVQVWDDEGEAGPRLTLQDTGPIRSIAWHKDKRLLIATTLRGLLKWTPATGQVRSLGQDNNSAVLDMVMSPDGRRMASSGLDGQVRLWSMDNGQALREPLASHPGPALALAWSPDGSQLATSGWDSRILLVSTAPDNWARLACRLVRNNPRDDAGCKAWR